MKKQFIPYEDQGTALEGFLVQPHTKQKLPLVILCHAWRGRDNFVCEKAEEIASWGYAAFALDMFGKGVLGTSKEENAALIRPFMEDRKFLQRRLDAALKSVHQLEGIEEENIVVMGFCFGGLCALDFARTHSDIKGAISVHGLLTPDSNHKSQNISAKILVLHGHEDPMVPPEDVLNFEQEMTAAAADWQVHVFGNTMHAFTNPIANDPAFGTVYNPLTAQRSWKLIRDFLEECFKS